MLMFFLIQFSKSFVSVKLLVVNPVYRKIYGTLEKKKNLWLKNGPECEVEVLWSRI